jgi:hypothetical protein
MATYDVTDYGATGDGSTDDTSAIRSAMDDAAPTSNGNDEVYFPAGTYLINNLDRASGGACLHILSSGKAGLGFRGEDADTTTLRLDPNNDSQPATMLRWYDDSAWDYDGGFIHDLTFDGNESNIPNSNNDIYKGVLLFDDESSGNSHDVELKNVRIKNLYGMGTAASAPGITYDRCSFIRNGTIYRDTGNGWHHMNITDATAANPVTITNSFFDGEAETRHAVDTRYGASVVIDNCYFKNQQYTLKMHGNGEMTLTNSHVAGNVDYTQSDYPDGQNYSGLHSVPPLDNPALVDMTDVIFGNGNGDAFAKGGIGLETDDDTTGELKGDNILVENTCADSSNQACEFNGLTFNSVGTIGIRKTSGSSDAVNWASNGENCDGDLSELQYEQIAGGVGDTASVTVNSTVTSVSVSPTVPSPSDVGVNSAGGGGVTAVAMATAQSGGLLAQGGATGYE